MDTATLTWDDVHLPWDIDQWMEVGMTDVPTHIEHLPDGREIEVVGDVTQLSDLNSVQGDNPYGYLGTCGLVSCKNVLRAFGINMDETDLVSYATRHGWCDSQYTGVAQPEFLGGASSGNMVDILTNLGVPAHSEIGVSAEQIADQVSDGHGAIISVNAGVLYNRGDLYGNGLPNHAITVIGVAREPGTETPLGFFVNDSNFPQGGRFVDVETLHAAGVGGKTSASVAIFTDDVLPTYQDRSI